MPKRILWAAAAALALSGCTYDPQPTQIDFGKVLVGETATGTARYVNNSDSKNADVVGYTVNRPFEVSGRAENVPSLDSSSPVTATFSPKAAGRFEDEVRPGLANAMELRAKPLRLKGEGVWRILLQDFGFDNLPPDPITPTAAPIQGDGPVDFGTRRQGNYTVQTEFKVTNSGTPITSDTATLRLIHGDRKFRIVFPTAFNPGISLGAAGREVRITFNCDTLGEFFDVLEVADPANPGRRAMIVLKGRVTESGE